jgi:hypothetical protein
MKPQNFNDLLCLFLVSIITAVWIVQGCGKLTLPAEVTGALIVTWSLMVQYYFRKSKTEK